MRRERKYRDETLNRAARELGAYKEKQRQIEYLSERLSKYRERYSCATTEGVKTAGGVYCDRVAEIAAQWADLEVKIQQLRVGAERELTFIDERLSALSVMQKRVLEMYYIKGYSVVKIARVLNYSEEWVKLTKNAALKKYASFNC